ncbi:hypothetical protein ACQJBY_049291 [Aegilops geniculata]
MGAGARATAAVLARADAGGDIVHQDVDAPKILGYSNDFMLVFSVSPAARHEEEVRDSSGSCPRPMRRKPRQFQGQEDDSSPPTASCKHSEVHAVVYCSSLFCVFSEDKWKCKCSPLVICS